MGYAPRGRALVGAVFGHSIEDRKIASAQLSSGFALVQNEVMTAAGWSADPYHEASGPIWDWWKLFGVPIVEGWQKFQSDQHANWWLGPVFATSWDEYEKWQSLLVMLRAAVRKRGIKLISADPVPLPTTTVQDVGHAGKKVVNAAADAGKEIWSVSKLVIYGGLGLIGAIAIGSLAMNLKSGKDPAQNYLRLAGRR